MRGLVDDRRHWHHRHHHHRLTKAHKPGSEISTPRRASSEWCSHKMRIAPGALHRGKGELPAAEHQHSAAPFGSRHVHRLLRYASISNAHTPTPPRRCCIFLLYIALLSPPCFSSYQEKTRSRDHCLYSSICLCMLHVVACPSVVMPPPLLLLKQITMPLPVCTCALSTLLLWSPKSRLCDTDCSHRCRNGDL